MKNPTVEEVSLVYDPLDPSLSIQHRAGIAGLYLQIKAMERLRENAITEQERNIYIIPNHELDNSERSLTVYLTKDSFNSLIRERYKGIMLVRTSGSKGKKQENGKFQSKVFIEKMDNGKFKNKELRPALNYFEAFLASEQWQEHVRDSCWNSFLCIHRTRESLFRTDQDVAKSSKISDLWKALTDAQPTGIDKSLYLNCLGGDIDSDEIKFNGKYLLLLHFWPLVSTFFTPVGVEFKKGELKNTYLPSTILVPNVLNVGVFVRKFIQDLQKDVFPGRFISTPLEASLAFFAPHLAYHQTFDPSSLGVRSAEVYIYRRAGNQAVVRSVENDFFEEERIREYRQAIQSIRSMPYKSLRVENLINGRTWHEGFEQLIARYPISLFVAVKLKDGNERILDRRAAQMARSIRDDFNYHEEQDRRMKKMSPETLIWRIVRRYVTWQACNKAGLSLEDVNRALKQAANAQRPIQPPELRKDYSKAVQEVTEKEFILFRGRRDKDSFADAFSEVLFRAPIPFSAEQAETVRPYYEGDVWESGRRLVLMAISAAGASASFGISDDASSEQDDLDVDDESDNLEVDED